MGSGVKSQPILGHNQAHPRAHRELEAEAIDNFVTTFSVFLYVARSSPTTMLLKLRVQRNPKGISWTCTLRFSRSGVLTDSVFPTRSQMMLTRVTGPWSTLSSKLGFCCTALKRSYQLCTFKKGLWQNNIITLEVTIMLI